MISQAGRRGFDPRLPLQNQQVNGPQNLHSARRVALLWGPEALSVEESRNSAEPGNIFNIENGSNDLTGIFLGIRAGRTRGRESRFDHCPRASILSLGQRSV